MNELLFECYSIPKVAYGVDCLFSFDYNKVCGEIMTSLDFKEVMTSHVYHLAAISSYFMIQSGRHIVSGVSVTSPMY